MPLTRCFRRPTQIDAIAVALAKYAWTHSCRQRNVRTRVLLSFINFPCTCAFAPRSLNPPVKTIIGGTGEPVTKRKEMRVRPAPLSSSYGPKTPSLAPVRLGKPAEDTPPKWQGGSGGHERNCQKEEPYYLHPLPRMLSIQAAHRVVLLLVQRPFGNMCPHMRHTLIPLLHHLRIPVLPKLLDIPTAPHTP
jgi:hypothetical protein